MKQESFSLLVELPNYEAYLGKSDKEDRPYTFDFINFTLDEIKRFSKGIDIKIDL